MPEYFSLTGLVQRWTPLSNLEFYQMEPGLTLELCGIVYAIILNYAYPCTTVDLTESNLLSTQRILFTFIE